jgi:hypothetical protein
MANAALRARPVSERRRIEVRLTAQVACAG